MENNQQNSNPNIIALIILIGAVYLGIQWFNWKLVLVIFLMNWANNIERRNN